MKQRYTREQDQDSRGKVDNLYTLVQVKQGMCLAHQGDMGEALHLFQALLAESADEFEDLYLDVADLLLSLGQPEQA